MVNDGKYVYIYIYIWLVVNLPLWKMMELISWDYEIPIYMEKNVPHHQPDERRISL